MKAPNDQQQQQQQDMAKYPAVVFIFPLLPLSCLLFAITTLTIDSFLRTWIFISFGLNIFTALIVTLSILHYIYFSHMAHQHYFLLLPLLLSYCAFGVCVIPFRNIFYGNQTQSRWFTWFLTLPISILAVAFAVAASSIIANDHRHSDNNVDDTEKQSPLRAGPSGDGEFNH